MTLLFYCMVVMAVSLAGGWLPGVIRLTHVRLHALMSLVAGFMLGVAVFHMVPHSIHQTDSPDTSMLWLMIGLLGMFFLVRGLHFHQHGSVEESGEEEACEHEHDGDHAHHHGHQHRMSWTGVFVGMTIHTIIDGLALASGVLAVGQGGTPPLMAGVGTFLAITLHKPLDSMSITTLMAASGWSRRSQWNVNVAYSAICPAAALLVYFGIGMSLSESARELVIGSAMAFSAGVFLCIALGDLLPEIQFHSHDRLKYSLCLLIGVTLAWAIRFLEPANLHDDHEHERAAVSLVNHVGDG